METLRHILMHSQAEDLAVLNAYLLGCGHGGADGGELQDEVKRYQYVNGLIAAFRQIGQNFFYAKMEYGDLVHKLAETLEAEEGKPDAGVDAVETAIVKRYILKNLAFMPPEQKRDLMEILGVHGSENEADKAVAAGFAANLPEITLYRILTWFAAIMAEVSSGSRQPWDAGGIQFFGRKEFRFHVIYSVAYVALLRYKYRYHQEPKCASCGSVLLRGAKFCSECGAKIHL